MFYLLPPRGFSNLSTLENDIDTRFKFLQKIIDLKGDTIKIKEDLENNPNFCSNLDCLIEGSRRDCASHFILRLACLHSGQMQDYWVKGETELFLFRLKSEDDLNGILTNLFKDIRRVLNSLYLTEDYDDFLNQLFLLFYPVQNTEILYCKKRESFCHSIEVPWTYVQDLVSRREVQIRKGIANVSCSHFLNLLASIFRMLLYKGIEQLKRLDINIDDVRIIQIMKNVHYYFLKLNKYSRHKTWALTHRDVEKEITHFPLCMQQLHFKLREFRRLNHHERFRYSLFLKDIGLPLEENVSFWKSYYSEAPKCCHTGCQHTWNGTDGKRFEYGIRHLYGKEGKRISYNSHSCSALQALSPQPQEAGGCPFMYLERSSLIDIISKNNRISQIQLEAILKAIKVNNPSYACGLFLAGSMHEHIQNKRELTRFSSRFSNRTLKDKNSFRKCHSAFEHTKDISGQNILKSSCSSCRFNVIGPEMSFMSPNVYFHLMKMNNRRLNKIEDAQSQV